MSPDVKTPEDFILGHAERQFTDEPRLMAAVNYFKEDRLAFDARVVDFDFVVTKMNLLFNAGNVDQSKFRELTTLKSNLGDQELERMFDLAQKNPALRKDNWRLIRNVVRVFKEAKGEDWEWAKSLNNPQRMASGMLIEGFGLLLAKQTGNPEVKDNFVLAFEEVGLEWAGESGLMQDVKDWMVDEISKFPPGAQEAILVNLADEVLGKRKHVKDLISYYQENPEKIKIWEEELNETIRQFNQTDKFPDDYINAVHLKKVLKNPLPSVNQVRKDSRFFKQALEEMNNLGLFDQEWKLDKLAAACVVAFYRSYLLVSQPYLKQENAQVASAVEEMLALMALNGERTELFQAIKFWIEDWEREGFSQTLAQKVKQL